MKEFHNFKIPVWPHEVESAEDDLCKARLLLYRLSERSVKLAREIDCCDPEEEKEMLGEASEFLREISIMLYYMTDSMEFREEHLGTIWREAVDKIVSQLPPEPSITQLNQAA